MYPQLTVPLLVLAAAALALVAFLVAFRPVLRRLAVRQVARRPVEAALVVLGSVLGTALIVASLSVGDSFNRSVRTTAYQVLGPVDEEVRVPTASAGQKVETRLNALRSDPRVDGVLTAYVEPGAAVLDVRGTAEPRSLVWGVDFADAARFGSPHPSGLAVADPGPGKVVINENLADSLGARVGDAITYYVYGRPVVLKVDRVVPAEGLGGVGLGAANNRDAFVPAGTLLAAAKGAPVTTITFVSNRGGVEDGVDLTTEVTRLIRSELGPLVAAGAAVETPKREVLDAAESAGNQLGSLFLFIASFSIIAGVLLIVNIFVMLIEERTGQLGILRAVGIRRRRVAGALAIEGSIYSLAAAALGGLLGVLLGRVVVLLSLNIINSFSTRENRLAITFTATPVSIANGVLAGFLIAFLAVVVTSVRISRTNIIAAIRDQQPSTRRRTRRRWTIASAAATSVLGAACVPALIQGRGAVTYLLPGLAIIAAIPLLRRFWPPRRVYSAVGAFLLGWGLVAHIARPHVFDDASTATYVVMGCMLTFGAVLLVSENQSIVLAPLNLVIRRPSQSGLAARLAVAYPTAKRFRTGATLAMYCIVVFVLVLLTQISAIIDAGVATATRQATAGWTLRADYNPGTPIENPQSTLTSGVYAGKVTDAVSLLTAPALGDDPKLRTDEPLPVLAIGVPDRLAGSAPDLSARLPGLADDAALWRLVRSDSRYVVIDSFYGSSGGGPPGAPIEPGAVITLTNPQTGATSARTVAGVLTNGQTFYGLSSGEFRFPVLMSQPAIRTFFGGQAQPTSVLLRTAAGTDLERLAAQMQGQFIREGLVVTDLGQAVRDNFAASRQFFLLMQGFLGLGLLVGISGLGVIMVRAVRERRRTIAMLRALGFAAHTVRRSFVTESAFVAAEGVIIGTALGLLTTWLLYRNSRAFGDIQSGFPIAWADIAVTVGAALLASLLATIGPARRAARIKPAAALRIAD